MEKATMTMKQTSSAFAFAAAIAFCAGCSDDAENPGTPDAGGGGDAGSDAIAYAPLDASGGERVFLDLATGRTVTEQDDWHIAYQKYVGFGLNGGVSGDGNVGACIGKEYASLYTAEGEPLADEFDAVTAESTANDFEQLAIDACDTFATDEIDPVIDMKYWLTAEYGPNGPEFTPSGEPTNGFIIRSAEQIDDTHEYARVRVAEIDYETGTTRRIRYATERWNYDTTSFEAESLSAWLDFSDSPAYWDLETNQAVAAGDAWELSIQVKGMSWNIHVNSGVSGPGEAGVGLIVLPGGAAADVSDPTDTAQVYRFFSDSVDGTLSTPGNFGPLQYDVFGLHGMTPNFTHYLIQDAERIFKVQVLSNYGETNDQPSGHLYFRYGKLR